VVERAVEAGLNFVPGVGGALAVAFVTAVNWSLNERREKWLAGLAEAVEDLRQRMAAADFSDLASNQKFIDAIVSATRTADQTHQEEKLEALRNAVVNSAGDDAPDADTHAVLLGLLDRLTASHLRFLTMWDDPSAWFAARQLTPPQAGMAGSRMQTVDAGLPEMRGRQDFITMLSNDLNSAGLMRAGISGMVSPTSLMDRLTSDLGRSLVQLISQPPAPD
jgi:hypothetical protein